MTSESERAARVERAWDEAALGYDTYFGPRFAPYLGAAVGALVSHADRLPEGAIVVPCVGPGRELPALARAFSGRTIFASDLSTSMVEKSRERAKALPNVRVERADAMTLVAPSGGAAALLSVFGLQLLPDPAAALASWVSLLAPGAHAVVLYWLRDSEPSGPFHSMRTLLRAAGLADGEWERELLESVKRAGGRTLADRPIAFEMAHENSQTLWQALTLLGPLRGLMLARGEAFIAELGQEFEAELPPGPLVHTPSARLLVIER
ncbi:MAG TPA: class I SAM-dependent methyltransferase [Polyangiaceae bacterium]|jgi:SAM-dependent methyltransferase|nr:class I SAM-dependent methyltransferase [Polyangiaceae bacterium]